MPLNRNIGRADLLPPFRELFARNVKSCRGHKVIEYDRVLLAPAKWRYGAEVVIVEQMARQRRAISATVERAIDQLGSGIDHGGRQFRQLKQHARIQPQGRLPPDWAA